MASRKGKIVIHSAKLKLRENNQGKVSAPTRRPGPNSLKYRYGGAKRSRAQSGRALGPLWAPLWAPSFLLTAALKELMGIKRNRDSQKKPFMFFGELKE